MDEPIIDLHSDDYFMGEALRQAAKAYEKDEVPVGAVVVRAGKIIARAFNQVETLKDATAHAEMLALTQAESAVGDWRLTDCTLYVDEGAVPDVRRGHRSHAACACGIRRSRSQGRRGRGRAEPAAIPDAESSLRNHQRRARRRMPRVVETFFHGAAAGWEEGYGALILKGNCMACIPWSATEH